MPSDASADPTIKTSDDAGTTAGTEAPTETATGGAKAPAGPTAPAETPAPAATNVPVEPSTPAETSRPAEAQTPEGQLTPDSGETGQTESTEEAPETEPTTEESVEAEATAEEAIAAKADELKLVPHNDLNCTLVGDGCVQTFMSAERPTERIAIFWSPRTGAHSVDLLHYIGKKYRSEKYEAGKYGYPTSDAPDAAAAGTVSQTFEHGTIDNSYAASGQAAITAKATEMGYTQATNDFNCLLTSDGCVRTYKSDAKLMAIYWTTATGAHAVDLTHAVGKAYRSAGWEEGKYGYPTSDMSGVPNTKVSVQSFEHGKIVETSAHYAAGRKALADRASKLKLTAVNGYTCELRDYGCVRTYKPAGSSKRIAIYWTQATGARTVELTHAVGKAYKSSGYEKGKYGYPTSDLSVNSRTLVATQSFQEGKIVHTPPHVTAGRKALDARAKELRYTAVNDYNCRLAGNGCVRTYKPSLSSKRRMAIYWTAKTGARTVELTHAVGKKFTAARYERGVLGYPTGDMKCGLKSKGCVQVFQKGQIAYSPATGARTLTAQINYSWKARSSQNGTLGYPLQDAVTRNGKTTQVFQGGSLIAANVGASYLPKNECWAIGAHKTRYYHGWADRVSFTISEKYGTYKASFINCVRIGSVYKQEWKTSRATVGLKGFKEPGVASGHTMYRWSPQGSFTVTDAFGEGNPGTGLNYQKLNPRSQWSGTPGSGYNKYFESSFNRWPDEQMWQIMRAPTGDYRQGAVIDYNRGPGQNITQGAGFAIFLHANAVPTYGCIALDLPNVTRYLKTADKGDRIVMGVRADIFK